MNRKKHSLLSFWCPSPIILNAEILGIHSSDMKITNISEAGCWYALTNYLVVLTFQGILVNTHKTAHTASHPRRQHHHTKCQVQTVD